MADESRRIGRIGGLQAGHDCGTCADMLEDIKRTPRGNDIRLPIGPNTTSGVSPRQGVSPGRQADTAIVGGPAGGGHAGLSQEIVDLPPVDNPYEYEPIDPYDDRYDFRLGKKVNDIGINGTNPVGPQSFPSPEGQFDNPGVQLNPAADAEADDGLLPLSVPDQIGETQIRTEVIEGPAGRQTVVVREARIRIPGGDPRGDGFGQTTVDVTSRTRSPKALPASPDRLAGAS